MIFCGQRKNILDELNNNLLAVLKNFNYKLTVCSFGSVL
jgi:hypothetical protein